MSYITLKGTVFGGATYEKTLGEWGMKPGAQRETSNLAQDNLGFDVAVPADGPELFAYGSKVTLQLGQSGTPGSYSGGRTWFVGWRIKNVRSASGRMQSFKFKFTGPWGWFMERHPFQKVRASYSAAAGKLLPVFDSSVTLGQSISMTTQANGVQTTQMTIGQQALEILNFTIAQTIVQNGGPSLLNYVAAALAANPAADIGGSVIPAFVAANAQYAQFQVDPAFKANSKLWSGIVGSWAGYCPMDAANDLTCAEALKKTLKFMPGVSCWFDFVSGGQATTIPTLHIATRDDMAKPASPFYAAVTLPWGAGSGNYTSTIDRRDDELPVCVDYKYKITSTFNGISVSTTVDDIAAMEIINGQPTIVSTSLSSPGVVNDTVGDLLAYQAASAALAPYAQMFGVEMATFDFQGATTTSATLNTSPIPFNPATVPGDFQTWTQILASALSDATISGVSVPPNADGSTQTATLTNPDGSAADTRYAYFQIGGPVPKGVVDMANPNLPQGVQLTLSCTLKFTKNTWLSNGSGPLVLTPTETGKVERKAVSVYAYSMAGGVFTSTVAGEPIPFGLAAVVFAIQSIVQYDGIHGFVEADPDTGYPTITDPCPVGRLLNLASANRPEYASMNAQVQQVTYDLLTGHTELRFGVPAHLGGTEYIERLRINRGPRWFLQIAGGGANLAGAQSISGPTQLKDTQTAGGASGTQWLPQDGGSGVKPLIYPQTAPMPGITHDPRTTGQPVNPWVGAAPNAPAMTLLLGGASAPQSMGYMDANGNVVLRAVTGAMRVALNAGYKIAPSSAPFPALVLDEPGIAYSPIVRIALGDLPHEFGAAVPGLIYLQEWQVCINVNGTPTTMYAIFLSSAPYANSLAS